MDPEDGDFQFVLQFFGLQQKFGRDSGLEIRPAFSSIDRSIRPCILNWRGAISRDLFRGNYLPHPANFGFSGKRLSPRTTPSSSQLLRPTLSQTGASIAMVVFTIISPGLMARPFGSR